MPGIRLTVILSIGFGAASLAAAALLLSLHPALCTRVLRPLPGSAVSGDLPWGLRPQAKFCDASGVGYGRMAACAAFELVVNHASQRQKKPRHALIDARSAIRQISANDPETKIERAEKALGEHLRAFADRGAKTPRRRAAEWLALVDEAIALPHRSFYGAMGGAPPQPIGTLYNVLITLPAPEVWPEIGALAAKRPPCLDRTALLILCARLAGDDEGVIRLCDEYDRQAPTDRARGLPFYATKWVRQVALKRLGKLNEPKVIEQVLQDQVEGIELPNLTDLLPPAAAKDVILRAIQARKGDLGFANLENRKLAKQVVLEHLKDLPKAQWSLAENWSDLPYVQRLIERYGYASLVDPQNQSGSAQQIYFRDLALRGKLEEAVRLIKDLQGSPRLDPEDWGPAKDIDKFILALQQRVPRADLSDLYVSAAVASGHAAEATKRLRKEVTDSSTSHDRKLRSLGDLLALDSRVGDLRALARDYELVKRVRRPASDSDLAYDMLAVGLASGDRELIAKGIAHDLEAPETLPWQALSIEGRLGQLERLELEQLEKDTRDRRALASYAVALCAIYSRANRPRDILSLLKGFPYWPARDISELSEWTGGDLDSERAYEGDELQPVGFYAAWALSKTGQVDLAVRILHGLLLRNCNLSRCYILLNRIAGPSCLRVYDDLVSAHPFAPRPVLWKGDLQFRLGRTRDAEASVREAAAIDPAVSFQYREKLNSLLGRILRKKGDTEGARKCANRVAAVRLGSRASELQQVNLLPQARRALERAVALWPDDCALQAQLAHILDSQCLPEEAAKHYRKALAFLPACLGENSDVPSDVEAMHGSSDLEPVGIEILNGIIRAKPNDAEAYFARGRLNQNAGRSREAASDYRRAVTLDPRHVGALASLGSLAWPGLIGPEEAQSIAFKLIDLDADSGDRRRSGVDLVDVKDLPSAYRALRAKLRALPTQDHGSLFPLHSVGGDPRIRFWDEPAPPSVFPEFDRLTDRDRLTGWYFQSSDIGEIARLFHPTDFPFE